MEDPKLPEVDEEPLDPDDDVDADEEFGEPDEMVGTDEGDSGNATQACAEPEPEVTGRRAAVFHSPVSHLTRPQQIRCRQRVVQAALVGYHNGRQLHYTPGALRWDGIANRRLAKLGQYPRFADCSSFATWCLWNGLAVMFHRPDVVNGCGWRAGFTGTMMTHGKRQTAANCLEGDCVIYGDHGYPGQHAAVIVGRHNGTPMVVSNGSEIGPLYLAFNYRPDFIGIWRYI
jgi:hypothetical protein